uniref:GDSL esterase/lipase n=1 Tax=Oryza meridionalis TaxID=40149 RepID=A0A0E0DMD9_9ORYZ
MGIHIAAPEGRAYFHHPTGRLSDGRVILDFIFGMERATLDRTTRTARLPAPGTRHARGGVADTWQPSALCDPTYRSPLDHGESLNTHHLSPFMRPLGADYNNGVNFAIAGSTATPGETTFSLDVQLDQFIFFKERCLESIERGEDAPIDSKGFENALYTMDIGHNDLMGVLHLPYDEILRKLPPIVAEIRKAIETLHKNGAKKFWIHGTGALGCLPQKLATRGEIDRDLDEHGCITRINNVAKRFNKLLSETCDDLRLQFASSTIVFVDMFAIKYDLVANHTKHGIEKPLMTCCGHGGPPYNYDPKKSCTANDKDLCKLGEKFISWDGVHFTDAANEIVASKVISGEFSIPRIKLTASVVRPKKAKNSREAKPSSSSSSAKARARAMAMASPTNGGGGGNKVISLRLQYYCVLAAVVVAVMVLSLAFVSPSAMGAAVRQNLGSVGRTYFHHPTGRLSDGRVIIDFICESLNTRELNPYLKSIGSDYSNGVNFAMAGSTVSHGVSPYSLNVQVDQFVYFKHRSLELFERGKKGPVSKEGFENALYMMDIGHNDVAGVMHTPSDNWDKKFSKIVSEIKDAIRILYDNGARKFWIHGTGALGCLPALVVQEKGEHDAHGCLANYNKAARQFNKKLSHLCDEMRLQLKNATVVYTDMFAIKYDFVANHTKYGIKWPLMVCCGNGGPPYNFKPGKFGCDDLCEPGSKVLSWDGVHFTDFGSGLAAKLAMSGEYSKPKVKLASLVNAGSNKSSDS